MVLWTTAVCDDGFGATALITSNTKLGLVTGAEAQQLGQILHIAGLLCLSGEGTEGPGVFRPVDCQRQQLRNRNCCFLITREVSEGQWLVHELSCRNAEHDITNRSAAPVLPAMFPAGLPVAVAAILAPRCAWPVW